MPSRANESRAASPAASSTGSSKRLTIAALAAVALMAALLALLGGAQSDGRVVQAAQAIGLADFGHRWATEMGRPVMHLTIALLGMTSPEFAPALISALCIVLSAWAADRAARAAGFAPHEAALLAAFAGLNPAHTLQLLSAAALQYPVGWLAFMLALWAAAEGGRADARGAGVLPRTVLTGALAALSVVLMEPAVGMLPLLVLAALAGRTAKLEGGHGSAPPTALRHLLAPALRHAAPVLVGVAALAAYLMANPPSGYFVAERSAGPGLGGLLLGSVMYAVALAVSYGALALALAVFAAGGPRAQAALRPQRWLIAAGLLALLLAAAPYIAAGRQASYSGWHVRHLMFAPVGLGLLTVAAVRTLSADDLRRARRAAAVGVLMLALLMAWRWPWLAERVVKNDAVVASLRAAVQGLPGTSGAPGIAPDPLRRALVCVNDQHPVAARYINLSEWSAMAQWAAGHAEVIALAVDTLPRQASVEAQLAALRDGRSVYFWTRAEWASRCTYDLLIPAPPNRLRWYLTVSQAVLRRALMPQAAYDAWLLQRYRPVLARAT